MTLDEYVASIDRGEIPDVADPDVRAMVLRDHEPREEWLFPHRVIVSCERCGGGWPCRSIEAARQYQRSGSTNRKERDP